MSTIEIEVYKNVVLALRNSIQRYGKTYTRNSNKQWRESMKKILETETDDFLLNDVQKFIHVHQKACMDILGGDWS